MLGTLASLWLWALVSTSLLLVLVIAVQGAVAALRRLATQLRRLPVPGTSLHGPRPALQR